MPAKKPADALTRTFVTTAAETKTGLYLHSHGHAAVPLCIVGKHRTDNTRDHKIELRLSTISGPEFVTLEQTEEITVSRFADPHNLWRDLERERGNQP
jgi:hypothetical protein